MNKTKIDELAPMSRQAELYDAYLQVQKVFAPVLRTVNMGVHQVYKTPFMNPGQSLMRRLVDMLKSIQESPEESEPTCVLAQAVVDRHNSKIERLQNQLELMKIDVRFGDFSGRPDYDFFTSKLDHLTDEAP